MTHQAGQSGGIFREVRRVKIRIMVPMSRYVSWFLKYKVIRNILW